VTKRILRLNTRTRDIATAWPQLAFAAFVGILLFTRFAGPLRVLYPIAAIVVGWRLQRLSLASYVNFVFWLWFLTPFVRRIADMYAGFQEPSYVLLAPYLVTALSAVRIFEQTVMLRKPPVRLAGAAMFGVAALGAAVGIPFGLGRSPLPALQEILNWFVPLAFGWYLATRYDQVHEIERRLFVTFSRAGLVVGAYGIYQFAQLPIWDIGWMQAVEMRSVGFPEPFLVRVFSTMHSPGVLAFFLAIVLVLWAGKPHTSGIPSAACAGVTLLLSQVRSAWLAIAVSVVLVVARLKATQKVRTAVLLTLAVMVTTAFLLTPEMSELFGTRMSTIERIEEDESALSRMAGHVAALDFVAQHPLGAGIGQGDPDVEARISLRDSVIVAVLVQFGIVGTILYLMSMLMLFVQLWRYFRHASSPEGMTLAAAAMGLMVGAFFGSTTAGPVGMCLWMIGGLAIADRHLARQRLAAVQAQAQRVARSRAAGAPHRVAG